MHIPPIPHLWALSPRAAVAVQRRLAGRISRTGPRLEALRLIAGLDAAFSADGGSCLAAVVLWDRVAGQVVEEHVARRPLRFPYLPGLLSFREAPALLAALRKLRQRPDALMCDGQGLAHPRRFGIACHVGLLCGLSALGCAKSRLVGEAEEPAPGRGSVALLREGDEAIGEVVRTQDGVRPVFVSVGHRLDLETARALVLACTTRYRLPEPTRRADRRVAQFKREQPGRS